MLRYNTGLQVGKKILKITDNQGQAVAELTVCTLKGMCTEESFALFFDLVNRFREVAGTDPPVLPRKRRSEASEDLPSKHDDSEQAESCHVAQYQP